MTTATFSKKIVRKKVLIPAVLGVGIILSAAIIVASPIGNSLAQQRLEVNETTSANTSQHDAIPKINGSVNVRDGTKNFFAENVETPFIIAAQTAQEQVANGTVLGGHLGVTQGYLTYTYFVVDSANDAAYKVVIDAGNGQVLYSSEGKQMGSSSESMFGPFGHGFGLFGHGFGHFGIGSGFGGPFGGFWHNK